MADKTFSIDIRTGLSNPGAFQQASQGLNEVQGATRQLAGETEKLTQELADLEAGERSLKTTFGGAVAARMQALREELALRKEISAEIKATPAASGGAGGGSWENNEDPVDEPKGPGSFAQQTKGFRGPLGAQRMVDRVLNESPERLLETGAAELMSSLTASAGPLIAALVGIKVASAAVHETWESMKANTPGLEESLSNLRKSFGDLAENGIAKLVGGGDNLKSFFDDVTRWFGGETTAVKFTHAAIEGLIGQHERLKTTTENMAQSMHESALKIKEVGEASATVMEQEKALAQMEFNDTKRQAAKDQKADDESHANGDLSDEDYEVKKLERAQTIADAEAALNDRKEAAKSEHLRNMAALAVEEERDSAIEFGKQIERVQKLDELALLRTAATVANNQYRTNIAHIQREADKKGEPVDPLDNLRELQKRNAAAKPAIDLAKEIEQNYGGKPPVDKEGARAEKELLEKTREATEKATEKREAAQQKLKDQEDLEAIKKLDADKQRAHEEEMREREKDRVRGLGDYSEKGSLTEQQDAAKQAQWEAQNKKNLDKQTMQMQGGHDHGSPSPIAVDDNATLKQIESNTRNVGGGSSGGSGVSTGGGGGGSAPHQTHHAANPQVNGQVQAADAQLVHALDQAKNAPNSAATLAAATKAQIDHFNAVTAARNAGGAGGPQFEDEPHGLAGHKNTAVFDPAKHPGHTNSAVTGHGESPQDTGKKMGEGFISVVEIPIHKATTDAEKAKMDLIARLDADAKAKGKVREIGHRIEDPEGLEGDKGAYGAGGRSGSGLNSTKTDVPDTYGINKTKVDPEPFSHQQQPHREQPAGTQLVGTPDTSPFAHMPAMLAALNQASRSLGQIANGLPTHVKEMRGRNVDPFAR